MIQFPASELALNDQGQVYHLALSPNDIADKIIVVGDPRRVETVASFFDEIELKVSHREFNTITGFYKGTRISVVSTGIGTDNIDIVINELDALVNIDLEKRSEKVQKRSLEIVRIGTCGLLQGNTPIHSFILSEGAFGLDNVAHFYPIEFQQNEKAILSLFTHQIALPKAIVPYFSEANLELVSRFNSNEVLRGYTVTSSGFYGPQGRSLRLGLVEKSLNEKLASFDVNGLKILNFEMESSALFALGKALGHKCTTLCVGVANRVDGTFSKGCELDLERLIMYVLNRI